MKVIIAGSRGYHGQEMGPLLVKAGISRSGFAVTEVVSGTAQGIDKMGEQWAEDHGIPIKRFPANWNEHGKAAGPIRNKQMSEYADALIAVWDGKSRGTRNMIENMELLGKPVFVQSSCVGLK